MADPVIIPISLKTPAVHIDAAPGTDVVIHGFCTRQFDGKILDAATTSWPKDSPGGASIDAIGLIQVEAGGLHLTSRGGEGHEAHLVVTGKGGEECGLYGVVAPCLILDSRAALGVNMTMPEHADSLVCSNFQAELPPPPLVAPLPPGSLRFLLVGGAFLLFAFFAWRIWSQKKRRDASPEGQLIALANEVKRKLSKTDPILAAPLVPAVDSALRALREKRVEATSSEGKRVAEALRRVNARMDDSMQATRAAKEQETANELVAEMESAIEAADEVKRAHAP